MRTRVKICGITRLEDAQFAVRCGVDALGFIFWSSSPRYVEPLRAREIIRQVAPFVATVGVFVNPSRDDVMHAITESGISYMQFHGEEDADFCAAFDRPYLKAFKVGQMPDLIESTRPYSAAAGLLFDAYDDHQVGGTGKTFDWNLISGTPVRPMVLSGGLNSGNIEQAIRILRPYAVDVSSGVETDKGIKDPTKMSEFFQGVRNADQ